MATAQLKTWTTTQEEEDRMYDGHLHHWRAMIALMDEQTLAGKKVLDFGCNQGGFLRTLYKARPFEMGVGIDIAAESLALARQKAAGIPAVYETAAQFLAKGPQNLFDMAFSHEVIYLLPDLAAHAQLMRTLLKPGATYYAATGCHTENPLWKDWHPAISAYSNIPVPHYSLNDYVAAFVQAGFDAEFRPFGIQGFIPAEPDDKVYYPSPAAKADYYARSKMLFRFTRKD